MTQDIQILRNQSNITRRATVASMEDILYTPYKVLDHGFIRVVDYMGDDSAVVQAARVSYGKGTKKLTQDQGLINYLMRHRHSTPFEMCEIKLHVKLPIFIARQWIRHRTASVNEYSARYSILDNEFYIPREENLSAQSEINSQGRGKLIEGDRAEEVLQILKEDSSRCYSNYQNMLNEDQNGEIIDPSKDKVARELARMNLPVNSYTQWYWKIDLHNFMNFISLRADSHAQFEIRAYADIMNDILKKWVPFTYEAFEKYRLQSVNLSGPAWEVMVKKLRGESVSMEESSIGAREWNELSSLLEKDGITL
jgi:thymidylate synthase (FAD)